MKLYSQLKEIDKKFSWSFLGFLIGIIGIGYSVYITYYHDDKPNLYAEIITNTDVFDFDEPLVNLKVFYDSINVVKGGKRLRIITFKFGNNGSESVTLDMYDDKAPLGIVLKEINITEKPQVIDASNVYLKENFIVSISGNKLKFSEVILDPSDFVTIKVLGLVDKENSIEFIPTGKIAKVSNIELKFTEDSNGRYKIIEILSYIISSIFITILMYIFFILPLLDSRGHFQEWKIGQERKQIIKKFKEKYNIDQSDSFEKVFDLYYRGWSSYLSKMLTILDSKGEYNDRIQFNELKDKLGLEAISVGGHRDSLIMDENYEIVKFLLTNGIMNKSDNGEVIIDEVFKKRLEEFMKMVEYSKIHK